MFGASFCLFLLVNINFFDGCNAVVDIFVFL